MSYSCTAQADETMNRIQKYFSDTSFTGGMVNTFEKNGCVYFWERGKENADGAITGSVFKCSGKIGDVRNSIISRSSFRINANGTVKRFPFYNPIILSIREL